MEKIENRVGAREEMKPLTQVSRFKPRPRPAPRGRNANGDVPIPPLDGLIESTLSQGSVGRRQVCSGVEDSHRVLCS